MLNILVLTYVRSELNLILTRSDRFFYHLNENKEVLQKDILKKLSKKAKTKKCNFLTEFYHCWT